MSSFLPRCVIWDDELRLEVRPRCSPLISIRVHISWVEVMSKLLEVVSLPLIGPVYIDDLFFFFRRRDDPFFLFFLSLYSFLYWIIFAS